MTRRLVLTADDLGRDAGTNVEIAELVAAGLVTATTLITVTDFAADAADRLRGASIVPHLHVTLTTDTGVKPWHPLATDAVSLVDSSGTFHADPFELGASGAVSDVIAEADAQLAWMRQKGIHPAAADSHTGTLYGLHGASWLEPALRWCARNGLDFRLPRDPVPYMGAPLPAPLAAAHEAAVALADSLGVRIPQTIMTNRRTAAELGSYERLRDDYLARLDALPEGTSELFMHPSRPEAVAGPEGVVRVWEARLARDSAWHDAIATREIELVASW